MQKKCKRIFQIPLHFMECDGFMKKENEFLCKMMHLLGGFSRRPVPASRPGPGPGWRRACPPANAPPRRVPPPPAPPGYAPGQACRTGRRRLRPPAPCPTGRTAAPSPPGAPASPPRRRSRGRGAAPSGTARWPDGGTAPAENQAVRRCRPCGPVPLTGIPAGRRTPPAGFSPSGPGRA